MVQLHVLSGKMAGTQAVARRFPFRIGRAAAADLRLEDAGVWDQHFRLEFQPAAGLVLTTEKEAIVTVNDQPVTQATLRNGDLLGAGSVRLQFWLAETRQRGLWLREAVAWSCIALVTVVQIALLCLLLR